LSKDIECISFESDSYKTAQNIYVKRLFSVSVLPSLVGSFLTFIMVIAILGIFYKFTRSTEIIRFPPKARQVLHKNICYKIDPYSDVVEMIQKLDFKYSLKGKEKAINLVSALEVKEIQKRAKILPKLLYILILTFLFLTVFPTFFTEKFNDFLFAGKILIAVAGIIFFYLSYSYDFAMEYYKDSYCDKCGKHLVLEEFQPPIMKEESRTDTYTKSRISYWRCKNCGYKHTKVEPEHTGHHYEKKLHKSKGNKCIHCGRANAVEEYRIGDIIRDIYSETKRRYYRCKYCGYHEIKIHVEIYSD